MRVAVGDRIDRWRRARLVTRGIDWLGLLEKTLLVVLALLLVRLVWAVVTPVGSFGPWEGRQAQLLSPQARALLFGSFDPFFRAEAPEQSGGVVTSLALTVYGIRLNEGSGLGSAIIATPDGVQNSYAVGDEIMPGVVLKAVAFDHVTIDRGGAEEQAFLDQSTSATDAEAPPAGGAGWTSAAPPPPAAPGGGVTADMLKRDIGFAPRMENGRVTGLVVAAKGPGFATAGFRPGDIVTQVNGQSVGDLQSLQNQIAPGARLSLTVERGAAVASVNLIVQGQ
ncbi:MULTISPECIES: type II secretion system protein N [Sphingobium]|jgi:general secretion pathway protein C|uniref:type II secretion system protein N n=1 Tax=Sphingobium TaxID=165695 RepID=UPI000C649768|nr:MULTISPECIES: type II secretion system protein N [Sphingobium]MAP45637.1 secretion system protein C [Sphingobium sp.]MEC9018157.1 type II secretion system protein N [Pseudomonadota bacterium]MBA37507.1 secretion system protein C [Sphingobium sp.]MBS47350.1 secretion system protein C [Sphingobium sp.]MCC4257890.1 PDZ domain-containing protein [Sphingobium lactosutens]|tara:strand:- start:1446 stop:2288 length:843 start_codon:yes stop_codon:yes gene_type:complete